MARRRLVVIGFVGSTLDAGKGPRRWDRWRPTLSLCQHEDLVVDRLELLGSARDRELVSTLRADIAQLSPETTVRTTELEFKDPWDFEEMYAHLHDFARSMTFHTEGEEYLIHITTGTHVAQICMFLLTESRHFPARLIQTSPPKANARHSPGAYAIIDLDLSRYDRLATRFREEHHEGVSFLKSGIDTKNAAFNVLVARMEEVAIRSRAPILLMGPTGAGKSHLARKVFELKKARRQVTGAFVELNCATLRGDAAMSALFGHVKGAFTGAVSERAGLLRKANGGLLFLDEIGELGSDEQAMLLRAIEEKVFYAVGSDREERSEFQLIAGTNRDLARAVGKGTFREDLLARINLWTFRLPGLRDRLEDVAPNLEYELGQATRTTGTKITFNREARDRFLRFATSSEGVWAANFRDFSAAVLRMATLATGGRITVPLVDEEIDRLRQSWAAIETPVEAASPADDVLAHALGPQRATELDRFDRVQLVEVLRVCARSASLSQAGRELFAQSRDRKTTTNDADRLRKYLARFNLSWQSLREPAG